MLWWVQEGWKIVAREDDEDSTGTWLRPLSDAEYADHAYACSSAWPEGATRYVIHQPPTRKERKRGQPIHRNKIGSTVDQDVGTITREEYHAR